MASRDPSGGAAGDDGSGNHAASSYAAAGSAETTPPAFRRKTEGFLLAQARLTIALTEGSVQTRWGGDWIDKRRTRVEAQGVLGMTKSDGKRPIDMIRDSALSMRVGAPEDGAICEMISIGDQLHIVSEHAIFAVQLADEIDPVRTNAAVPNTNQKVLSYGAKDAAVGRILLTARAMFKASHLGREFPEQKALKLAFDLLRDVAAMLDMHVDLVKVVETATGEVDAQVNADRSLALPAVGDAKSRCDAFAQKVGHAIDTMKEIARLFYPGELNRKWIDSLIRVTAQKHGDDEPLSRFMVEVRDSLLFMRKIRNMVEHPKDDEHVIVHDFRQTPKMTIVSPHVEIVRHGESVSSQDLRTFMTEITEELLSIVEMFIALLCGANAEPFTGFPLLVVELPESRRPERNPHQRFSYGISMNGAIQPLG